MIPASFYIKKIFLCLFVRIFQNYIFIPICSREKLFSCLSLRLESCIDLSAKMKRAILIVPSLHSHVTKSHIWKESYACDDAQVPTLS